MTPEIELMERAVDAVLSKLAESRNTSLLLAKALLMSKHWTYNPGARFNDFYICCHCKQRSRDYAVRPDLIAHEINCPVVLAKRVLQEITKL